jgi:pimeloyl-ACP methyl ester carboxylesterase
LQHGFTNSSATWDEDGYLEPLARRFQVVLIDARGHGQSDKPHDPTDYSPARLAADVTCVLDSLGIEKSHFFGYSMGGSIGACLARHAPHRLRSLVIGGAGGVSPPEGKRLTAQALATGGMEALVAAFADQGVTDGLRRRVLANDVDAMIACITRPEDDGAAEALQALPCPYLLIAGDQDAAYARIEDFSRHLRPSCLVTLAGLTHLGCQSRSDLVLPHLLSFLDSVEAGWTGAPDGDSPVL